MEAHGFIVSESKHSIQLISKKLNKSFDFDIFIILNKIDTEPYHTILYHMHSLIEIYSRKSSIYVYRLNISVRPQNERDLVFPMEYLGPVKVLNRVTVIKMPPVKSWENWRILAMSYARCYKRLTQSIFVQLYLYALGFGNEPSGFE